jgi:hypothetical protein
VVKTYLLTMFYPSLAVGQESVRQCHDAVKKIAGGEWKLLRAGGNSLAIAFTTDIEPSRIQKHFTDAGRREFQFLIVEIATVVAGWTDPGVYEWIQGRLGRG